MNFTGGFSEVMRSCFPRLAQALRAKCPPGIRRWYFRRLARNRMTKKESERFRTAGGRLQEDRGRLVSNYHCGPLIDPPFVALMKKFFRELKLSNFVETGTFDGETALAMSLIFNRVFTCDIYDYDRRPEFYFRRNIVYETSRSQDFLLRHLPAIRSRSLFYLDAHWEKYWPIRDELSIVLRECENPLVVLDDFDAGNDLECELCGGVRLDLNLIRDLIPEGYNFFLNDWSNRKKGFIFLVPGEYGYGCPVRDYESYSEKEHGLWNTVLNDR